MQHMMPAHISARRREGSHKPVNISESPDAHTLSGQQNQAFTLLWVIITQLNVISQVPTWDYYFGDLTNASMKRVNSKSYSLWNVEDHQILINSTRKTWLSHVQYWKAGIFLSPHQLVCNECLQGIWQCTNHLQGWALKAVLVNSGKCCCYSMKYTWNLTTFSTELHLCMGNKVGCLRFFESVGNVHLSTLTHKTTAALLFKYWQYCAVLSEKSNYWILFIVMGQ